MKNCNTNRAITLELILVNATITFQSQSKQIFNKVLNVYESKDYIS